MSRDNPDLSYALGLSPNDAAAYLDSLGVRPTTSWHDLLENARASAFTVAQMTKLDLLNDVFGTLKAALKDGMTAMKKIGRYDGVITAYRKERMALMDTRKERLK